VAVGDFNGDGMLDLAVTDQGTNQVSVLFGNGNGTFGSAANYWVGLSPRFVTVSDVNGDGKPDLIVADAQGADVSVLLNRGHGTFRRPIHYLAGPGPNSVAVGDFTGDDALDLAVANAGFFSSTVTILLQFPSTTSGTAAAPGGANGRSADSLMAEGRTGFETTARALPGGRTMGDVPSAHRDLFHTQLHPAEVDAYFAAEGPEV
jgi:hypothetical protein